MIRREVMLSPEAQDDLLQIYEWIAENAPPDVASGYLSRLEGYILGLDIASERGTKYDDIRPGLRIIGFEKRVTIAFCVIDKRVLILRVLYGGQDWRDALDESD